MSNEEFEKYVDLIASMSIDYILYHKLTRETYLSNLETMIKIIKDGEQNA